MDRKIHVIRTWIVMAIAMLFPTAALAQQVQVSGLVVDETGEPLMGVSITIQGKPGHGTTTNLDGEYKLSVDAKETLSFTYIGYMPVTEKVDGRTVINVTMKENSKVLDEVVVIGYGTMDKKEVTSAISHVSSKDFLSVSSLDPSMLIQGKVAGVSITNTGAGDPNHEASIQVRGVSSREAGLGPLIVIDGVPGGNLTNLNPNDIASFDVLKDGAASAIYGTRGSNGVILVTTKKGSKDGTFSASYATTLAFDVLHRELNMMSAQDYRDIRLGWGDRGVDLGGNDDWLDAVSRTGFTQQHTLTFSGGSERFSYRVSADYRNAHGIDLRSRREEYGARASVQHTTKGGLFNFNVNIAPRIIYRDQADWGVFINALEVNPTTPIYDPENPGQYYNIRGQVVGSNPVESQRLEKDHGDTKLLDMDGTIKLNLLPLLAKDLHGQNLSTQLMFADHQYDNDNSWFRPSTSTQCINNGYTGEASRSYSKDRTYLVEWLTNYSGSFGDNNIKAMVGYSYQYSQYSGFSAWNKDFPNDALTSDNLGSGELAKEEGEVLQSSYRNDAKLISFFGRVSYDWKSRYFATVSLRHEGSSKFGAKHKWGNFPAVSAGWRITEEEFMKGVEWLDELKLRGDFGVTGNQNFGSYKSLNTMSGFGYYTYNDKYYQVWGPGKNVNPDLHWEKGKNWNVGVDFSMFNSRFYGSINYFNRRQQDLLGNYKVPVPPYLFDDIFVNVGTMQNTGVEIDLNATIVSTRDFDYTASFIGTWMSNKFVDFSNSEYIGQDYYDVVSTQDPAPYFTLQRIEKGKSLGNFYMWKYAGITTDGHWLVYDKDGDIIRASQASPDDRQIVGNGMPKFTMSMNHKFRYKNFDLALFFRGAFGFHLFNIHDFYYGTRNFTGNLLKKAFGKNFDVSPDELYTVTDYYLERGDYLKLDQITLGYNLRTPKLRFMDGLRVYATAKNVFTITKFSGVDPSSYEVNGLYPGAKGGREYYPSTRQFIVGVQIDF